jgi:HEAT repeats
MPRQLAIGLFLISFAFITATADTVHFKDGATLNGKVSKPNENSIAVQIGGGRMVFPMAIVEKIEENDLKTNKGITSFSPGATRYNDRLQKATGLSSEQRAEIRKLVAPLGSHDTGTRVAARKALLAKAQEVDFFAYLALSIPKQPPRYVPEILRVLFKLDPAKTKKLLLETVHHPLPVHRGSALELLGMAGGDKALEALCRGLVADPEPVVRYSSARGLAHLRDKRSTPALLKGLKDADARVRNLCSDTLASMWSTPEEAVKFGTVEEWQGHWAEVSSQVSKPVSVSSLKPLSEPLPEGAGDYN